MNQNTILAIGIFRSKGGSDRAIRFNKCLDFLLKRKNGAYNSFGVFSGLNSIYSDAHGRGTVKWIGFWF